MGPTTIHDPCRGVKENGAPEEKGPGRTPLRPREVVPEVRGECPAPPCVMIGVLLACVTAVGFPRHAGAGRGGSQGKKRIIRMSRTTSVYSFATLVLAAACADPGIDPPELVPTTLEVSPQSLDFDALFATARLEATVVDQHGNVMTGVPVSWQSSSFDVARVDQAGLVTAVDNGSAYIVAAVGAATDSARIAVQQRPHSVRIPPPDRRILTAIEDTLRLSASVLDPNGRPIEGAEVAWSTSDTTIVAVDEEGLVTSVTTGTAFVRANRGDLADSVIAEVRQVPASVRILPEESLFTFVSLGDTLRLSAEVVDANGYSIQGLSVSWSTTEAAVAEIDGEGLLTATGNGTATISATALGASGSTRVEVEQVPTSVVVVSPTNLLPTDDSVQMKAEALDAGGSVIDDADFEWMSSDTSVATVTSAGWVHAAGVGTATITATLQQLGASLPVTTMHRDEFALRAFYRSTHGELWAVNTNWDTDAPLSDWYGVELNGSGRVRSITLAENNLAGRLPPEIGKLNRLEELHLETNLLEGTLLPEIGELENLVWLGLYDNYFDGTIPPEIGRIEYLEVLDLSYNLFTGTIPGEIIDLPYLTYLGLFDNELSGPIPPEIGNFQSLRFLDLCYNKFTGPIPREIARIETLEVLELCGVDSDPEAGNRLTGRIPPELGNLTNLRVLDLGANRLEGPIPAELGQLLNLDSLSLYSNLLTAIPAELGNIENLQYLSLYGNRVTGSIPKELGNLGNLQWLLLGRGVTSGDNIVTGSIPREMGNLTRLLKFDLGGNNLTGTIPAELGQLRSLGFLDLHRNKLTGQIPPELGDATQLTWLNACPNQLSGPIPPEIGKMKSIRRLYLCSNNLTGTLPPEMGNLRNLEYLHLGANQLTGAFPSGLLAMKRLQEFYWHLRNKGLCAPDTQPFQSWLAGMRGHSGIFCTSQGMAGADAASRAPVIPNCSVTQVAARSATGRSAWTGRWSARRAFAGLREGVKPVGTGEPGVWRVPCNGSADEAVNW